jgi:hypothetical protein
MDFSTKTNNPFLSLTFFFIFISCAGGIDRDDDGVLILAKTFKFQMVCTVLWYSGANIAYLCHFQSLVGGPKSQK